MNSYITHPAHECISDCRSENGSDESDVIIINATSPPEDITKYAHRFLEYVCKGEHVERDITRKDSVVIMDAWDFARRHLYYESHPLALNILVQ